MKIQSFCDSKPKTNLSRRIDKNCLRDGLVKPTYKFARLVTKISSKIRESKTDNKVIGIFIYSNR